VSRRRWRTAQSLLCAALGGAVLGAAPDRSASPQRLPDWFGQWEIVGATPSVTGGMEQSLQEAVDAIKSWETPPYTPQMRKVFDQAAAQAPANASFTHPLCSFGFPMLMLHSPLMFEILPTPKETAMVFSGREIRHIYTDGRPHPPPDDLWATYWGDSVGHWEGPTLVVDTIEVASPFVAGVTVIVVFGGDANDTHLVALLSPAAHFIERIRMTDKDHLQDRMTIIDPNFFTAPWHITRRYQRVTRIHRMVHEDCVGDDRNPIVNGQYTLAPPAPEQASAVAAPPALSSAPR
jgi:hypothetical protein